MFNISIIIPHKNIPDLLGRCISSIPDRKDIEIIVVDDNSDEPLDTTYFQNLKKETTIHVLVCKANKGAGHARNLGIAQATGRWLMFSDADDFYNPCFEERLNLYLDTNIDLVLFNANSVNTTYYVNSDRANYINRFMELSNSEQAKNLLRYKFGEPWSKMIKKSLVDKFEIKFDEIPIHNDTTFSLLVGHHAERIVLDKYAIYCVTTRLGSLSNKLTDDKRLIRIDVFSKVDRFFSEHNVPLKKINRHFIALMFFRLNNKAYYKKGIALMEKNHLSKGYIRFQLIRTIPSYILFVNKEKIQSFLSKFN